MHGGDNAEAAACDLVVIATLWDSAATTAREYESALAGKVVVCMANALIRVGHKFQPARAAEGQRGRPRVGGRSRVQQGQQRAGPLNR